jgi:uncharacterized protein (DUF952 family)
MMLIYKISPRAAWDTATAAGVFTGAPVDIKDGYIHFSAAHQVRATAEKHFHGVTDLVLASIDATALGDALRWEPSRGGDLFPHLYGSLTMTAVRAVSDLPLDAAGTPIVPEDIR